MSVNDITVLAQSLTQADPSEAARIWTNVAGDKSLAIKVHKLLTHAQRIELAEKLVQSQESLI
jgi:hypothetical protein